MASRLMNSSPRFRAAQAGIGAAILEQIFEDIHSRAPKAIVNVKQTLPADFPEEIAASIIGGFNARLERLAM